MGSGNLVVERTEDPRVFRWMLLQSSEIWRDQLTREQYVERDDYLTPCKLYNFFDKTDPTGIYYFVMKNLSIQKPEDCDEITLLTYNIVCSCELVVRKSWRFTQGVQQDVLSGCIGSVYTLSQHRSKGYALFLMAEVEKESAEIMGLNGFLSLYSEVDRYYEKFGYHSYPVDVVEFGPISGDDTKVKALGYREFDSLILDYKTRLSAYLSRKQANHMVSIVPTPEMIEWHHIRSRYISKTLYDKFPQNFGFQIDKSFTIFSHDYGDNFLVVHIIYATNFHQLSILLRELAKEANRTGFEGVHIWESQLVDYRLEEMEADEISQVKLYIENDLKGNYGVTNGSLSSLKMLDGSFTEWGANHKWPWF